MQEFLPLLHDALKSLAKSQAHLPPIQSAVDVDALREVLLKTAERMQDNYPYGHPLFFGQMLKPPHPVAWLAYALAMTVNPNNHALDGGRASAGMEREAVAGIARMFGWETHLGHLTSGGTLANFEALWVARESDPAKAIAASSQAHYTHSRLSAVLRTPFESVAVDGQGRMDLNVLEDAVRSGRIATVVATAGTTALGVVDPIEEIVALKRRYGFRLHVDAAYGGYYRLVHDLDRRTVANFAAITHADSIAIDPHKHGLQPYGCGCVLFRDPRAAAFYHHESPYTYFLPHDLHLGEISLECSRAGAAAVALWTTMQLLPLAENGEFSERLAKSHEAAKAFAQWLGSTDVFRPVVAPELDIVVWAVRAESASKS
jgi:glutamate/tyrosine decarboxylase-like PLP-dependent enzyme